MSNLRISQRCPVHPGVQLHLKPPSGRLRQLALFKQGLVAHGSTSVKQNKGQSTIRKTRYNIIYRKQQAYLHVYRAGLAKSN